MAFLKYTLRDLLEIKRGELPIWATSDDRDAFIDLHRKQGSPDPIPSISGPGWFDQTRMVSVQIVPYQSQACFMTIISDITEQKQHTARLQDEFQSFRADRTFSVIDQCRDAQGKTVLWNHRSEELLAGR